ncbi:ankyrin and armadillo repeat containing [Cricetulus griseus]
MDCHRLPDEQALFDQPPLLMGVGVGDSISLNGIQPDLCTTVEDSRGKPLLECLIDITNDPDFVGIYDEDMNEDPTYDPNSPEEKAIFMKYAENIMLKLTFSTTRVQQHENIFIFETDYWITNAIKFNQDYLDICTYQRLQQRLRFRIQRILLSTSHGVLWKESIPFGMKSAVERGLSAVFHTFSRRTSSSTINVSDEAGYAIFHHAALHNRVSIICQLCNANFNVNQRRFIIFTPDSSKGDTKKERNGPTPLHLACQACSLESTVCLLCFKADYTLSEKRGWMPIHFAAFYDNICIIIVLCRKDPSLLEAEATAENQCTPLLLAATSGALDTIQYLFSLGANWRKTDIKGNNIIHLSVLTFHTEVLKYIIELNIPELPVWKTLVEMLQCESFKRRMMAVMSLEVICLANDQYWKCILDAGAIPALINLLKYPKIKLQCKTVGLLSNISTHVSVVHALVEGGGIPALINLLGSDEPELHSRCAVILYDIAMNENKDVIAQYNGIPALINLLNLDMESVLVNVMNCIRVLCMGNEGNQRAMVDHNGIQYLIRFLSSDSDILKAVSSATIAEVGRDNRDVQDAIAMEGAIPPLVDLFKGKQLSVQVKGAMAVESLANYNPLIQKAFLKRNLTKDLLKLLKAFQLNVKEQGAVALWALAGQTLKQQKYMAEQIGYNFIINMLLSPSAKMQYVGNLIASLAHCRVGIPDAFTTLGAIRRLCYHLYSGREEVRTACSCALGYLTYNAYAFRILLSECRNKPNQFLRITNNISRDAKINPAFLKEFQMQQHVGLPSLRPILKSGKPVLLMHSEGRNAQEADDGEVDEQRPSGTSGAMAFR